MFKMNTTAPIILKRILFNLSSRNCCTSRILNYAITSSSFFQINKSIYYPQQIKNSKMNSCLNNITELRLYNSYSTYTGNNKKLCVNDKEKEKTSTTKTTASSSEVLIDIPQKLGLLAKFKLMYRKYWYVLIPVHVVTSVGWLGGFYYLSKSGVDIPALLQSLHVSEVFVEKLKYSDMGHYAIAYLCYKIATPVRYAVTLGGTTVAIKYLVQHGYIKPVPTKQQFIQMYEDKKAIRAKRKQEK